MTRMREILNREFKPAVTNIVRAFVKKTNKQNQITCNSIWVMQAEKKNSIMRKKLEIGKKH